MSAITQTVKSSQKFQISRFLSMILVWSLYRTEKICRNCITLSILKFVIKHTYTLHMSYWSIASTFLLSMNYLHVVKSTTFISKSFPTQSLTVGPFCAFRWCSGLLHSGRIYMDGSFSYHLGCKVLLACLLFLLLHRTYMALWYQ